ncbi:MAG TPA: nicotinate-nucleotide adenylyltransferase [Acidimicrobiales bacterium]|nr:nicotinate-nucleotide adenylyltransferase [Acidimicrobiales bacterium]
MPQRRRVGVLGGTFDPIHIGHLVAASEVRVQLRLDTILLVVAGEPWQKTGIRRITPAADRLALVEVAVDGFDGLEASSLEIERGGPTYTADTLAALEGDDLFLVVGADVASLLDTWARPEDVRARATLVVVDRPGSTFDPSALTLDGWRVERVDIPRLEVSSSDLRARVADGRPIDFLVPDPVVREIEKRGLYARSR